MNHPFIPKLATPALCAKCDRDILAHSKSAQCEACPNIGPCDMLGNMLLCASCMKKEYAVAVDATAKRVEEYDQGIRTYGDFFNAKVTPIVAVKELYELNGHTFAEFHERIKLQIEHFAKVLFESTIQVTEDSISKLLVEFRAEVRTKLKESDINYQPPSKAPKVNVSGAVRKKQSPIDKMAEMVVAAEGKKGNVITLVEAKRKLMAEMGMK